MACGGHLLFNLSQKLESVPEKVTWCKGRCKGDSAQVGCEGADIHTGCIIPGNGDEESADWLLALESQHGAGRVYSSQCAQGV